MCLDNVDQFFELVGKEHYNNKTCPVCDLGQLIYQVAIDIFQCDTCLQKFDAMTLAPIQFREIYVPLTPAINGIDLMTELTGFGAHE